VSHGSASRRWGHQPHSAGGQPASHNCLAPATWRQRFARPGARTIHPTSAGYPFPLKRPNRAYADSKTLTEAQRAGLFAQVTADERLAYAHDALSAALISQQMLGRWASEARVVEGGLSFLGLVSGAWDCMHAAEAPGMSAHAAVQRSWPSGPQALLIFKDATEPDEA
jgi:hypothetical protein